MERPEGQIRWEALRCGDGWVAVGPDDGHGYVAKVRMRPTMTNNTAEMEAHVRLVTAAPELVTALEAARTGLDIATRYLLGTGPQPTPDEMADAVIAVRDALELVRDEHRACGTCGTPLDEAMECPKAARLGGDCSPRVRA